MSDAKASGCGCLIAIAFLGFLGEVAEGGRWFLTLGSSERETALANEMREEISQAPYWLNAALLVGGVLALALVSLYLASSQFRQVKVLVAYHHHARDQAKQVHGLLKVPGISTHYVSLEQDDHDSVVATVRDAIKRCDVLLALPGPRRSFVDAEILAASALDRVILLVATENESSLPDTALQGYPVLSYDALNKAAFRPLASLILHLNSHWRASTYGFTRAALHGLAVVAVASFLLSPAMSFLFLASPRSYAWFGLRLPPVALTLGGIVMLAMSLSYLVTRRGAERRIRRGIRARATTNETLNAFVSNWVHDGMEISDCLMQPLPLRHSR